MKRLTRPLTSFSSVLFITRCFILNFFFILYCLEITNPYNVSLIRLTVIHHFLPAPGLQPFSTPDPSLFDRRLPCAKEKSSGVENGLRLISKRSIKLSCSGQRRNFNSSLVLHGSNAIKRISLKRSPISVFNV